MQVPFYDSTREYKNHKQEFDSAINSVLEKGDFILGGAVSKLESEIAFYNGSQFTTGVANGSDALVIASDCCNFKNGAEVITPVFTFFASASCISRLSGKPVFCDVEEDTCLMDMNATANLVTKNTTGILPVHLFAQMADMNACMKIARENNLHVVEDAAEAFGMKQIVDGKEKFAGNIGDMGVYSFFPTKTLGGYGDGGMILFNDEALFNKAKSLRVHGATKKYHHDYIGYNSRLDTLQAAVLSVKLKQIDVAISKRAKVAEQYLSLLKDIPQVKLPVIKKGNVPVYYVFNIRAENRDDLNEFLHRNEIGTSIYYPVPLHLQKCFEYLGYKKGDFPIAEKLCEEVLALPIFPEITEDEVSFVCERIKEFYKK